MFAVVAEACLFSMGGQLKRKEMLSARLGDMLSELFLMSAVLKRWHDEDKQPSDLPVVHVAMQLGFYRFDERLKEVLDNMPSRPLAWLLRPLLRPLGMSARKPDDMALVEAAELLLSPSPAHDRLTGTPWDTHEHTGLEDLEKAFALVVPAQALLHRLRKEGNKDWRVLVEQGELSEAEQKLLHDYHALEQKVIAVDDFAFEAFAKRAGQSNVEL